MHGVGEHADGKSNQDFYVFAICGDFLQLYSSKNIDHFEQLMASAGEEFLRAAFETFRVAGVEKPQIGQFCQGQLEFRMIGGGANRSELFFFSDSSRSERLAKYRALMAAENVAVALTHPIVVALERKLATFSQVAPAKKRMKKASKYPAIQGLHLMYQAIASLPHLRALSIPLISASKYSPGM
ncbi:hypothetical protein [Achromobacter xylosoxidans]|uniref:hypothetical protein n=1 Tax=Alcaligenes xylosoxydans xylosoxydans TaxID=85698 RepID=UPI0006695AA6|nr:hypothetical protein [Achromobacter xylosoxidans]